MRVLCINNKLIVSRVGRHHGAELREGKVYNTISNSYMDAVGMECYYIDGIGEKLKCRFIELEDEKEEMIIECKEELIDMFA